MITTCKVFSSSRRAFPAPLRSSTPLNYLQLIQIRKLKSRSSVKALCWVMRRRSVSQHLRLNSCVSARVQLKVIQAPVFKAVFHFKGRNSRWRRIFTRYEDRKKRQMSKFMFPIDSVQVCAKAENLFQLIWTRRPSGKEIGLYTTSVPQGNLDHCYRPLC